MNYKEKGGGALVQPPHVAPLFSTAFRKNSSATNKKFKNFFGDNLRGIFGEMGFANHTIAKNNSENRNPQSVSGPKVPQPRYLEVQECSPPS